VTAAFEPLADCEAALTDWDELIYRQVTEYHWDAQSNTPATHAFGPSSIDKGKASYSRSSVVSAEASRMWHNQNAASHSKSVWGVSVREVIDQETRVVDDVGCPGDYAPGHCYVDFRHLAKTDERKVRGMLLARALARGELDS